MISDHDTRDATMAQQTDRSYDEEATQHLLLYITFWTYEYPMSTWPAESLKARLCYFS